MKKSLIMLFVAISFLFASCNSPMGSTVSSGHSSGFIESKMLLEKSIIEMEELRYNVNILSTYCKEHNILFVDYFVDDFYEEYCRFADKLDENIIHNEDLPTNSFIKKMNNAICKMSKDVIVASSSTNFIESSYSKADRYSEIDYQANIILNRLDSNSKFHSTILESKSNVERLLNSNSLDLDSHFDIYETTLEKASLEILRSEVTNTPFANVNDNNYPEGSIFHNYLLYKKVLQQLHQVQWCILDASPEADVKLIKEKLSEIQSHYSDSLLIDYYDMVDESQLKSDLDALNILINQISCF